MIKQRTLLYGIFICGVFIYIDRWFKWQSLHDWSLSVLINSKLGWLPFLNDGVAFGLPVPMAWVKFITVPLIVGMGYFMAREYRRGPNMSEWKLIGFMAVISGAVSNLVDRLVYNKTIDYILIFTGVINLADVIIIAGFLLLYFTHKRLPTAT